MLYDISLSSLCTKPSFDIEHHFKLYERILFKIICSVFYNDRIKQKMKWQFIRFVATGGAAAVVNFGSRIIYSHWMNFSSAIVAAYLTGMVTAFILARIFVFNRATSSLSRTIVMFSIVNLAGVIQVWFMSVLLADYLLPLTGIKSNIQELAHGIGIIVPVFTSFFGHKYLSFK